MDTVLSKIAYLDCMVYNMFPRGSCSRISIEADVEGNFVKTIKGSYRVLRCHGINGVEITLSKGKKPDIKIKR